MAEKLILDNLVTTASNAHGNFRGPQQGGRCFGIDGADAETDDAAALHTAGATGSSLPIFTRKTKAFRVITGRPFLFVGHFAQGLYKFFKVRDVKNREGAPPVTPLVRTLTFLNRPECLPSSFYGVF
jgi:hypothetical protein